MLALAQLEGELYGGWPRNDQARSRSETPQGWRQSFHNKSVFGELTPLELDNIVEHGTLWPLIIL